MVKIMYKRGSNPCPCQVHHVMKICVYCIAHSYSHHHVSSILGQTNVYKRCKFYNFRSSLTLVSTGVTFHETKWIFVSSYFRGREFWKMKTSLIYSIRWRGSPQPIWRIFFGQKISEEGKTLFSPTKLSRLIRSFSQTGS